MSYYGHELWVMIMSILSYIECAKVGNLCRKKKPVEMT